MPVLEESSSVAHMAPKRKVPSQKRENAKNQIETMVTDFSTFSIRKAVGAVGVSPTLVYHILHHDLHVKPYKYQEGLKLEECDFENSPYGSFHDPKIPSIFQFCSDEVYFNFALPLNKQNNRIWSNLRPLEGIEVPLHVLVWRIF